MKKKTESLPNASGLLTCTCGAMPYDAEKRPHGRVGERGSTQIEAKSKWNARLYKYGTLKEVDS